VRDEMNIIGRKNFFSLVGKGMIAAAIASALPHKFFSSALNASAGKKIKIEKHPSAVKRNDKV
jgi:hypothetical protein